MRGRKAGERGAQEPPAGRNRHRPFTSRSHPPGLRMTEPVILETERTINCARSAKQMRVRFDLSEPAREKRDPVPALPDIGLISAEIRAREVPFFCELVHPSHYRLSGDADLRSAAVVAREDDQRVAGRSALVEPPHDLPHSIVGLHHQSPCMPSGPLLPRHSLAIRERRGGAGLPCGCVSIGARVAAGA
jgi:hypothetical protein